MEEVAENDPEVTWTDTARETLASEDTDEEDVINGAYQSPPTAYSTRWQDTVILPEGGASDNTGDGRFCSMNARAKEFLESPKCDFLLGVIISANAMNIGMEQTYRATGEYASTASALEHLFLSIYTAEILVRFFAFGSSCLQDGWVRFDLLLVVMGITTQWIMQPILGDMSEVGPVMVLRSARLMRLAKTVKLLIHFRELWMLVQGLLSSANTMMYTLFLIFALLYMFACLGMELLYEHPLAVGPDRDEEFAWNVEEYFRSLPIAMLSLLQFVCWDNPVLIYRPLVVQGEVLLCLYFMAIILVVGIVVMNLVTAVVVNSALEQTAANKHLLKAEEEKRKKKILKELRKMFERLDEDGSGQLSRDEIASVDDNEMEVLKNLTSMDDPVEIFDCLDVDGSGDIEIDEFCDGLWEVAISKTPLEVKRMEKQIERIRHDTKSRSLILFDVKGRIDNISHQLAKLNARPPGRKHCLPVCSCKDAEVKSRSSGRLNSSHFDLPQVRSAVLEVLKDLALSDESLEKDRDRSRAGEFESSAKPSVRWADDDRIRA